MWYEAVVAKFKSLSRNLPGGIEENQEEIYVRIASLRAEI
jgi:hypothetical protein